MTLKNYRFALDKSSKKYLCPGCQKKRFVRYIEVATNRICEDETAGRCDREQHCQYHKYPDSEPAPYVPPQKPKPVVDIPKLVLDCTIENHGVNTLIKFLYSLFNPDLVETVLEMYHIGTAGPWLTIPYITETDRVRAIQTKKFDETGHTTATNWIHWLLMKEMKTPPDWIKQYDEQDHLKVSCLFGAHLLKKYPKADIALVEAPKTALICTMHYGLPGTLWMATYNKSSLTEDKIKVLRGRKVTVYPDLGAFKQWSDLATGFGFGVNDYIEKNATPEQRAAGLDIADFIINSLSSHTWH